MSTKTSERERANSLRKELTKLVNGLPPYGVVNGSQQVVRQYMGWVVRVKKACADRGASTGTLTSLLSEHFSFTKLGEYKG